LNKKEFFKYLDNYGKERLRMKISVDKGIVTDIVIQYESFINNRWVTIIRYDCAHGYFHRDIISPKGDKEKHTIAISELEDALLYAEQDIKDRWNFYKQKYLRKLKK
jgi:hypothetical protein